MKFIHVLQSSLVTFQFRGKFRPEVIKLVNAHKYKNTKKCALIIICHIFDRCYTSILPCCMRWLKIGTVRAVIDEHCFELYVTIGVGRGGGGGGGAGGGQPPPQ